MPKITESESIYQDLEQKDVHEILQDINREDQKVALAVKECIPQIDALITQIVPKMKDGGRLFYIGAGTSGRLGVVDASECPPTFGVPHDMVVGLIAGGDSAIRKAVEFAEDSFEMAKKDLQEYGFTEKDCLVGIAASGTTPYVLGGLAYANELGSVTGGITNNPESPVSQEARFPVVPIVGPEYVTGSTRMKSGTSQKLVLNMISTAVMIQLGRVVGNRMVDMQLSNKKLWARGIAMIQEKVDVSDEEARALLEEHGSVRAAIAAKS